MVGLNGPALISMRQHAFDPATLWKSGGEHLDCRSPCGNKLVQDSNRRFGTQRLNNVPNTSQ